MDAGPFDAATSQFGVMFFDEPVRAFANIRAHVAPGGPFCLADPHQTTALLAEAGWEDVTVTGYERTVAVDRDVISDDAQLVFLGVPDDLLAKARAAVEERLAPLERPDGRYDAPLAYQVVTARA